MGTCDAENCQCNQEAGCFAIKQPKPIWEWTMSGLTVTIFSDATAAVPNRFHRFMQKLILGIKWRKM